MAKKPRKHNPRVDGITAAQRVAELFQLRLAGAELSDLKQYADEQGWNCTLRNVQLYLHQADAQIKQEIAESTKETFATHIRQRRMLYSRCMRIQDYKAALAVLKDLAELENLYPAKKLEVGTGAPLQITEIIVETAAEAHGSTTRSTNPAAPAAIGPA